MELEANVDERTPKVDTSGFTPKRSRNLSTHAFIDKANEIRAAQVNAISALADARMAELRPWFASLTGLPRGWRIRVLFGNGCEFISIPGREDVYYDFIDVTISCAPPARGAPDRDARVYRCLTPLAEAIRDVHDITNGYRDGCPDDFEVTR